jgi:hypothetical protein
MVSWARSHDTTYSSSTLGRSRSVVLAPPLCHVLPTYMSSEPAGISTGTVSSGSAIRPRSQRWLPGTRRVPPISSVKSHSGHRQLTTTCWWGQGRG